MAVIHEEVELTCSEVTAFREAVSVGFMKRIDPNYAADTEIVLQNDRILRSVSKVSGVGSVEIERLSLPEVLTIITQRRPPLGPFVYQVSIQTFRPCQGGCRLEWTNEFELTSENRAKEQAIYARILANDRLNLSKTQAYFAEKG